nr:8-amino-7-oxononanoate synthase [Desulfobulbaceae bacterium]
MQSVKKTNSAFITDRLQQRRQSDSLRVLKDVTVVNTVQIVYQGQPCINFSSNDYLGLSQHPAIKQGSIDFVKRYGAGSTASRLVCGNRDFFGAIETQLAELKNTEESLIFSSGYQLNVTLLPALADKDTVILADRLCHNSLIQGALLSRASLFRFRHNELSHLSDLLKKYTARGKRIIIVTESVFSMDGDCCDIDAIISLAKLYDALLIVDEAHATGVLGPNGMGLACGKDVDVIMGTFGKGCGVFGAYVACSARMKEYLINFCNGFVYTTALPPAVLGGIKAALDIVPDLDAERAHLMTLSSSLRAGLKKIGVSTGESTTQIIPAIIGKDTEALEAEQWLFSQGYFAICIRHPTVEKGQARIRLALSSFHTTTQIDGLL